MEEGSSSDDGEQQLQPCAVALMALMLIVEVRRPQLQLVCELTGYLRCPPESLLSC